MTSEPMRDPVSDPLLTPRNAALLVIDYQPSQIQAVTSIDHDLLIRNIVSVARLARTYGLPIPGLRIAARLGSDRHRSRSGRHRDHFSTQQRALNPLHRPIRRPPGPRGPDSPGWKLEALTSNSWFGRRVFEVDGHLGQGFRDSLNGCCIDRVEETTPNASKVNRPCGLKFGHAPRSEPRNVAPCVGGTCRLCHEATRLEIVHQASHPARRQVGVVGQVGHSQLAIGSFGEMHDRCVLARRQASASDQVAVQMSRNDLDNSHHNSPQRFLGRREWLVGGHAFQHNLLHQAILGPSWDPTAPNPISRSV